MRKRGFTLIELLVVVGMLMLLMGSVTSAVMSARRRAKITKAQATCQELTNAFLALENYGLMEKVVTGSGDNWPDLTRNAITPLLGEEQGNVSGEKIPVLFNATSFEDPWGRPYQYRVVKMTLQIKDNDNKNIRTSVGFPNYYRIKAGEE